MCYGNLFKLLITTETKGTDTHVDVNFQQAQVSNTSYSVFYKMVFQILSSSRVIMCCTVFQHVHGNQNAELSC